MSENLTIMDWKTPKYIQYPCPCCRAEMDKTNDLPHMSIYECQVEGCTGKMVMKRGAEGMAYV